MSVLFISEVSSNHAQDLERSLEFIDVSADIGCDAVKFQLFKVRELFSPEAIAAKSDILDREKWELPVDFLPELAKRCKRKNIQFSCTPFYLKAVEELEPYVDFYKIASYEMIWDDLITACAETGKPLVMSTGMATMDEIYHAVKVFKHAGGRDLTLLHCTSAYPTPPEEANLAAIHTLQSAFNCKVGWSDHTVTPGVIQRAIHKWGASAVEFHLDLEGDGAEYGAGHCWLPHQIQQVIADSRVAETCDGDGEKKPVPSELPDREWRADPSDGLRPLQSMRQKLVEHGWPLPDDGL